MNSHQTVGKWLAIVPISIGLLGVGGSLGGIPWAVGAGLGLATIKFCTSLALTGAGVLQLRATKRDESLKNRSSSAWTASIGPVLLCVFGAFVLIAHTSSRDTVTSTLNVWLTWSPSAVNQGLPSILTAISLILLGTAYAARARDAHTAVTDGCLVVVLLIAIFALVGMLFLLTIPNTSVFAQMALPTGIALLALAVGGLLQQSETSLVGRMASGSPAGVALRWSFLSALLVPLVLGWAHIWTNRLGWFPVDLGVTVHAFSLVIVFGIIGLVSANWIARVDAGASAIFAAAPGALLLVDKAGVIRRANAEAERLFGYTPHTLAGQKVEDLVPPALRHRHTQHRQQFVERRLPRPMGTGRPLSAIRRDGTSFEIEASLVTVDFPEGPRTITAVADVSARIAAERTLFESEQRFRQSFENAAVGVALVGLDGSWLKVNQALCRTLGYSESELIERTFQDVTHPEDLDTDLGLVRQLLDGDIPAYDLEKRYIHRDGQLIHVLLSASLVRDGDGVPQYFISIVQDVTARKLAQQQLQATMLLQNSILQATSVAIIATDENGRIASFNRGAELMLGYSASEVIGRETVGLIHDAEEVGRRATKIDPQRTSGHADDLAVLRRDAQRSDGNESEWTYIRKDGSRLPVLLSVSLLRDSRGTTTGFLGFATDITERKAADQALQASLNEKEVLLREIHHRVKNNLQVISSMLNLQSGSSGDPLVHSMFDEARDRIRTIAMVHDRLYRSASLSTISMTEHLRELALLQWQAHQQPGREVILQCDGDPIELAIDTAIPVGLIANELISNAFKHGFKDRRSGHLFVSLRRVDEDNLCLRVQNDGAPFAPDVDPRSGATLGLRLVRALLSQIEGHLKLPTTDPVVFEVIFRMPSTKELSREA